MAPEQFSGRVGPATDLFAWAGTLLFAATGRDPFAGGPLPAVMYRIMHETPDLSALPGPLAEVAAACLAKDPKARPASEDVLLWLLGERDAHPRPGRPPPGPAPGPTARNPGPTAVSPGFAAPGTDGAGPADAPTARYTKDLPGGAEPATRAPPPPGGPPPAQGPGARTRGGRRGRRTSAGPPDPRTARPPIRRRPGRGGAAPRPALRARPGALVGLGLAGLLAALDVAALAILIARPALSEGARGGLLPVVASSFAVLAVVTLAAVILAWRGGRAAAWTVMGARVAASRCGAHGARSSRSRRPPSPATPSSPPWWSSSSPGASPGPPSDRLRRCVRTTASGRGARSRRPSVGERVGRAGERGHAQRGQRGGVLVVVGRGALVGQRQQRDRPARPPRSCAATRRSISSRDAALVQVADQHEDRVVGPGDQPLAVGERPG